MAETMMDIIYITDSQLDESLAEKCRDYLAMAANGKRIISVSQKPLDFGDNICVGGIGRSALSIEKQIMEGLSASRADYVAIAEHDCIYSQEHFDFVPKDDGMFWYNKNLWVLNLGTACFSYRGRLVQSQMVCKRNLLEKATNLKTQIISTQGWPKMRPIGEPGVANIGKSLRYCKTEECTESVKAYVSSFAADSFETKIPNIDIRHGANLTGRRQGKLRRLGLAPWGVAGDIL
jgi:hypothetical protein